MYFNVQSKADMSQLNLLHATNNKKVEKQKKNYKVKKRACSEVSLISPELEYSLEFCFYLTSKFIDIFQ